MALRTITSANSEFLLTCLQVFPVGQPLQQFDTDNAIDTEEITPVETKLGVDAFMASGWVPHLQKMTVHFMADSLSIDTIDQIYYVQEQQQEIVVLSASILLPSLQRVYTCSNGRLTKWKPLPDAKKLLEGQTAEFTWNTVRRSNAPGSTG
jgi:hypothetical protein